MRTIGIIALLASAFVLGGCNGGETQTTGGGTTGTPGDTANALTIHTGEFEVPAGAGNAGTGCSQAAIKK